MEAYILPGIIIILVLLVIGTYNSLVGKRNMVEASWSNIDTLLQKRFDLVPNLVNTVKGYMQHERELLEKITEARSAWMKASTVKENAGADNMFSGALKTLFAVSENYPELKANQNFLLLQEELTGLESKIAYARQRYNRTVMAYNTAIQRFPTNILARWFKFLPRDYYAVEEEEARRAPEVKF
ncbi:MAG TPA: LemA family protein [Bacillota bacterium]|jgi:LemA protein|nr:LemA family protein [Bacillota bacterium]HOB86942.1 LemA family protein [Bacillota bacterium]HOP69072.1 LemA family protein [Bacillota bacterium]HPT34747.1 LemA family protein [Bacillota bacterium]HQD06305.1 LemA family protein [Bacillota bacterium]